MGEKGGKRSDDERKGTVISVLFFVPQIGIERCFPFKSLSAYREFRRRRDRFRLPAAADSHTFRHFLFSLLFLVCESEVRAAGEGLTYFSPSSILA